jgi:hypothetical protein
VIQQQDDKRIRDNRDRTAIESNISCGTSPDLNIIQAKIFYSESEIVDSTEK